LLKALEAEPYFSRFCAKIPYIRKRPFSTAPFQAGWCLFFLVERAAKCSNAVEASFPALYEPYFFFPTPQHITSHVKMYQFPQQEYIPYFETRTGA
jgi:hypothetical protein